MKARKHVEVYNTYKSDFFLDILKPFLIPNLILVVKDYLAEDGEDGRNSKNVDFWIAFKDLEAINQFEAKQQNIPLATRLIEALIAYANHYNSFDSLVNFNHRTRPS